MAGLALFLVGVSGAYAPFAVDVLRAQYLGGVPGVTTVADCEWRGSGWECWGEFTSDDGSVRLPEVAVRPNLPEWPVDPVPTVVSGTSASRAHLPDPGGAWIRIGALLVFAGLAGYFTHQAWKVAREEAAKDPAARKRHPLPELAELQRQLAELRQRERDDPAPGVADDRAPPGWSAQAAGPLPGSPLPRNPVLPALVAWQVLLLLAVGWLIWDLSAWNRAQDRLLSATVTAEVVATHLGPDQRIEVIRQDENGEWWTRLTPVDPDRFQVRDRVELRYDPDHPEVAYPVDRDAFELEPRGRNVGIGLLLLPGLLLAWAWTWRLGRWTLGMLLGRPRPAQVALRVAEPTLGNEPAAFWLELSEPGGTLRYQRVVWHRGLTRFAVAAEGEPALAVVRRCPGLRRMLVVDLPGAGRLWPASTARRRPPRNYDLSGFDLARLGERHRDGWSGAVLGAAALLVLMAMAGVFAGLAAAGYLLALMISFWFWHGAAPWHGLYAYRPPLDEEADPAEGGRSGRGGTNC